MEKNYLTAVIFDPDGKIVMTVNEVETVKSATQGVGGQPCLVEIIRGGHQKPVTTTLPILVYDTQASGVNTLLTIVKKE